jgi:hypothetical protein
MDAFQEPFYPGPYGNIFKTIELTDEFLVDGNVLFYCLKDWNVRRGRLGLFLFNARSIQNKYYESEGEGY